MKNWAKHKRIYFSIAAFLIPSLIMLFVCVLEDFYPFGKVSILVADMRYQTIDYIGYMKNVFFGNDDFLYSFSKTFGGDMTGFISYYLFNPFFLILLLIPNSELPAGVLLILILMAGCSGLTFHYLLREVYEDRFASLIFSTAYALMGYYVAYYNCIHYFFCTVIFPIVILGLYRTYRQKKASIVYILSVAICVCSNYYIGYMILIFTAFFFIFGLVINDTDSLADLKKKLKDVWLVLYTTIIGVMISAFSLVSVAYSLKGQKSSGLSMSFSRNFRLTDFFSGLYTNAFHGNISDGLPLIYSGIIPVIFLFIYFMNKNIRIKERVITLILFLFMIVSFWIDAINVAWHGFAHPIGFPYRNSFLFSFLVLFYGYKGFLTLKTGFKELYTYIFVLIFSLYSAYLILSHNMYVTIRQVAITGVFAILSLVCINMLCKGRKYIVPAIVGIIVLQIGDLGYNTFYSMDAYFGDRYSEDNSQEKFGSYVEELQNIVDSINDQDTSFFRMDKLYRRSHNDAMMTGYNGLSHFSSCETDTVKRFMGKMGFRDNGNWAFFSQGSTAFAESFMGLKYLLSQYDETSKPYEMYMPIEGKYVYRNPYALNLCFLMDSSVKNINMEEKDLFKLQNNIASSFSNNIYEIYEPVKFNGIKLHNVKNDGNTYYIIDNNEEAYVEYNISVDKEDFVFMYFNAPEVQSTELYVNGLWKEPCFNMYDWCIRECGRFAPGEEVDIKIVLLQDEIEIDEAYFYYENKEKINNWYKDVTSNNCTVEKISSSHLLAEVDNNSDNNVLVFSIPYEKDWQIYLDGKKVTSEKVMDALLGVEVNSGHHFIEMRYIPRGLVVGSIISIIGIIATFCVFIRQKIQNK